MALKRNKKFGVATSILTLSIEELMTSLALFNLMISESKDKESFKDLFDSTDLHGEKHDFALVMNETFKIFDIKKNKTNLKDINSIDDISKMISEKLNIKIIIENVLKEKANFNNWYDQANETKNAGLYVAYCDKI